MAYEITYKRSVRKDLQHLAKTDARRILDKIELELADKADAYPMLRGRFAGLRKLRVGDYRVIFALLEGKVLILRIGHRREVDDR
ncbi:MAG: type II toxin-antitoxin system RelE/ParE family toxin [Nitrospirae bacterium]|nr:type II toxin-antitoxin system RelE/ParE family toxin [Nitrospirota bacterium]